MLFKKLIYAYITIGIFLYLVIALIGLQDNEYYLFLTTSILSFICFGIVLTEVFNWQNSLFTKANLFYITLLYSLFIVACNHQLSIFINDDQFLFSRGDAIEYYNIAIKLSKTDINLWFKTLTNNFYGIDDWGAALFFGAVYSLIKSQTFLAIIYCVLGSLTALMLFRIGYCIMCRRYAFIAALSFAISSFILTYHGMFLKETVFVFIVVSSFSLFYNYMHRGRISYLFLAYLVALIIFLFRTPVALITIVAFTITLAIKYTNKFFLSLIIPLLLFVISTTTAYMYTYDRYLASGDVGRIIERKNEAAMGGGLINQLADPVSAFLGPFPSVVAGKSYVSILNSSGLIFRVLLILPFIFAAYYVFRYRILKLYPLLIFFLLNAFGVAITVKGLELRISLPHMFTVFLMAFWWLAHYDLRKFDIRLSNKIVNAFIIGVLGICLLWNIRSLIL